MLGDNIRKYRKENNISQESLGEKLGVSRQSISLWENNQTQPSLENIVALAKIFNVTTDDLLSDDVKTEKPTTTDAPSKKPNKKFLIWIMVAICVVFVAVCLLLIKPWSNDSIIPANPFSENVDAIAEKEASVVKVFCYDHNGKEIATGSGVVLFHNDMIVTNYHVIEDTYSVKISTNQDITYNVSGLWHENEKQDIAILKLEKETDLIPLQIGDSAAIKKGETVTAIGSPLGIKNTVSKGNLSARIMQDGYDVLQFSAPISNGSSGGALFNEKGEIVGITYASFVEGQNLNLAIPIELVDNLYQTKSINIEPDSFGKAYWENHIDEYYVFTYGKPIEVTFEQLKQNPNQYDGKYIKITACVSSVDMFKDDFKNGMYLSNKADITNNSDKDKEKDNNSHFVEHDFIRVNINTPFCRYTYGTRKDVPVSSSELVEVIGVFSYWEKGEKTPDSTSTYEYSGAEIDIAYLNGQR